MSDEKVGFVNMAGPRAEGQAPEIGIGMLGYAFMGKAHTNAYKTLPYMMYPPAAIPRLAAIAGRNQDSVREAARRYGYAKAYTDWRAMLDDPAVQLFDNCGPNDAHVEPCLVAAQLGKHVFCEKPLGRNAEESKQMWDAVVKAGVKHMVAFNYRFVPAVQVIRQLVTSGALGQIYHFRAVYLQEWIADVNFPMVWRLDRNVAGSGALGDLGAHSIDLMRYLVGEPTRLMAMTKTFITERDDNGERKPVTVDDAFVATVELAGGGLGTLEATRFAPGRKNYNAFEINAEHGSVRFNLERMNELEVFWKDGQPRETQGFTNVLVSESFHPYWKYWWPQGHMIGWEHTFIHEIDHLLRAITEGGEVGPIGATFEDGYRTAVICDAVLHSAETGRAVDIKY